MKILHLLLALLTLASVQAAGKSMIIVAGAPGEATYDAAFAMQVRAWEKAAKEASISTQVVGLDDPKADERARLRDLLAKTDREGDDLWIILIGHGTFDGRDAKFNLHGDDLTPRELGEWLKPFQRRVIILNLFAASGPFMPQLAGKNRVVLTATRSGGERNYSRLGEFMAQSLTSKDSDLDSDGSRSLRELAIYGAKLTRDFYETGQRLLSEHAMLDDNGDGKGFSIEELSKTDQKPKGPDGLVAAEIIFNRLDDGPALSDEQRTRRDKLEAGIAALREQKATLPEKEYYRRLEQLLLKLAAVYESATPAPSN